MLVAQACVSADALLLVLDAQEHAVIHAQEHAVADAVAIAHHHVLADVRAAQGAVADAQANVETLAPALANQLVRDFAISRVQTIAELIALRVALAVVAMNVRMLVAGTAMEHAQAHAKGTVSNHVLAAQEHVHLHVPADAWLDAKDIVQVLTWRILHHYKQTKYKLGRILRCR